MVAGLRQAENTGTQEVRHQVTTEMLQNRGEMMVSGEHDGQWLQ